ncbi:MAG: transposase [Elusimicrobiales bacterium]|nr:transposase [Elusimicrobiales bacterium]
MEVIIMPRKHYTEDQIVNILKEQAAGAKGLDLCRKYGISERTLLNWREKYAGMTIPDIRRLRSLEDENRRLKQIVADQTLELLAAKELLSKNW